MGNQWQCPAMMVGPVICGALLAFGHRLYYDSLNDTRVHSINQRTWALQIGTGFAFLIRSFLVAAVGVAAMQELWATLRKKSIRLYGINSMFVVMGSPLALLTWEVWVYAKTLTLLAILAWLISLAAIVTPATLSVRLLTTFNTTVQSAVLIVPCAVVVVVILNRTLEERPLVKGWASFTATLVIDRV